MRSAEPTWRWMKAGLVLAVVAALGAGALGAPAHAQTRSFTVGYFPSWVGAWPVVVAKKLGR